MSQFDTSDVAATTAGAAPPPDAALPLPKETVVEGPLASDHGNTSVSDTVVAKIAGLAAREVPGVHRLGSGTARALGSIRERIPGQRINVGTGVTVEVGQRQAAVDLDIVVEYGYPIAEVADNIRQGVIAAIEGLVGLEVTEVNIAVDDVHLPDERDDDPTESRVQ